MGRTGKFELRIFLHACILVSNKHFEHVLLIFFGTTQRKLSDSHFFFVSGTVLFLV